ncbi:hypothetical protein DFH06DRAFT_1300636 [Mycena polygramma]|nr:hypothetical protein DFH06DRAFT_1300636 [Mycena polygramma]
MGYITRQHLEEHPKRSWPTHPIPPTSVRSCLRQPELIIFLQAVAPSTTATAAAPQTAQPTEQTADTTPQTVPTTEPPPEQKKHGLGALVDKIVHPTHGGNHTHSHTDTVSMPVAVPGTASDGVGVGGTHLAPGGSACNAPSILIPTCKALQDPALDALWRTQTSIVPLLSCMPEDLFNINPIFATSRLPLRLTRPINTTDWEPSDPYASRVRYLQFKILPGLEHIYPVLDVCVPGGFVFPNLRSLAWTSREQPTQDFPHIRIFLSPTLLSINFFFAGSIMNCSLLATLGRICPNLTDLDLYCKHRPGDHKAPESHIFGTLQLPRRLPIDFHLSVPIHRASESGHPIT